MISVFGLSALAGSGAAGIETQEQRKLAPRDAQRRGPAAVSAPKLI